MQCTWCEGEFATQRHNEFRDNNADIPEDVTSDDKVELVQQPLSGKESQGNQFGKVRSDINAFGTWTTGEREFSNIRFFDPSTQRHQSKTLWKYYKMREQEKKQKRRIREFWTLNKELLHQSWFQRP